MALDFWRIHKGIRLTPQTSAPSSPNEGDMYFDSTLVKLRVYQGGAWVNVTDSDGSIVLDLGSQSAPSLSFTGDSNTGVYSPGADQVAITTGGTARFSVDNSAVNSTVQILNSAGSASAPSYSFTGNGNMGLYNVSGALNFATAGANVGSISIAGAWTLGPSSGNQSHSINGNLTVNNGNSGDSLLRCIPSGSSSNAYIDAIALNGGSGDAAIRFSSDGGTSVWSLGSDTSASQLFTLSRNTSLGTNNFLTVNTSGALTLGASGGTQTHAINGSSSITRTLGVTGSANPAYGINISGDALLTTTDQAALQISSKGSSAATNVIYGVSSAASTTAASFTNAFLAQFIAQNPTKGAGSTITRQVGFYSTTPTQGTNNASFADNASFTGNWFINSTSTETSLLSGRLGVVATPSANAVITAASNSSTILAGTTGVGFLVSGSHGASTNTSAIYGFQANFSTPNTSFTTALVSGVLVSAIGKGAAHTITRLVGVYASEQTTGTNNAAIADNVSFTGNWFINSTSSNASAFSGAMDWAQIATPSNPAAGRNRVYFKSDGNLYKLDSAGVETVFTTGAGGGDINNGGNTFGANITIGTNDAFALNFETNNVTKGSISSAGTWSIGLSSLTNPLLIFRDATAGASTNTVRVQIGNSGTSQGDMRLDYINAAAASAPGARWEFAPRNNADSGSFTAAKIELYKSVGADNGERYDHLAFGGTSREILRQTWTSTTNLILNYNATVGAWDTFLRQGNSARFLGIESSSAAGAAIYLYGNAHGTPSRTEFYNNSLLTASINSSGAWTIGASGSTQTHTWNGYGQFVKPVAIGGAAVSTAVLAYVNNAGSFSMTNTSQYGVISSPEFSTSATTAGYGVWSAPATVASAFTIGHIANFYAQAINKGAGSTITRITQFYAGAGTGNSTYTAALADNTTYTNAAAGTPWFINQAVNDGTANALPSRFAGAIGIGTDADNQSVYLKIGTGNILFGTTQVGIYNIPFINSTATVSAHGVRVSPSVQNAAFTLPFLSHYTVTPQAKGASATVTRALGIYLDAAMTTVGATNSAFIADNLSFTGDFFINQSGTTASVLGGSLRLPDGTNSVPALSFSSQIGMGLYRVGTDHLRFVGQDATQFSIFNTGTNDDSILRLENNGSSTGDQYIFFVESGVTASQWSLGRDDSDSGAFKLSQNSSLGTNDFLKVATTGHLDLRPASSQDAVLFMETTSTGFLSRIYASLASGDTTGDAYYVAQVAGGTKWSWGLDNSDSDKFKIANADGLGTSDQFILTTTGEPFFPGHNTTASAANAFLDSGTGELLRSTSSLRYKEEVVDMVEEVNTEKVFDLKPISFTDKNRKTRHIGLAAEQVAEVMPELVQYGPETLLDPNGDPNKMVPDGVQYQLLAVVLLEEVKKLRKEIEDIKKKV